MLSETIVNWAMEKNTREDFIFHESRFIQFSLWLKLSLRCVGSCLHSENVIACWTGHRNWPLWASCHPKLTTAHLAWKSFNTFHHFTVVISTLLLWQACWGLLKQKDRDKVYGYQMSVVSEDGHSEKSREWLSGVAGHLLSVITAGVPAPALRGEAGSAGRAMMVSAGQRDRSQEELRAVGLGLAEGLAAGLPGGIWGGERDISGKVLASVPLTADIEGSGLWRHILRDAHLHLHLKS